MVHEEGVNGCRADREPTDRLPVCRCSAPSAVDEGVQAVPDEPAERARPPRVQEVRVEAGDYSENLTINKSLTIRAENGTVRIGN